MKGLLHGSLVFQPDVGLCWTKRSDRLVRCRRGRNPGSRGRAGVDLIDLAELTLLLRRGTAQIHKDEAVITRLDDLVVRIKRSLTPDLLSTSRPTGPRARQPAGVAGSGVAGLSAVDRHSLWSGGRALPGIHAAELSTHDRLATVGADCAVGQVVERVTGIVAGATGGYMTLASSIAGNPEVAVWAVPAGAVAGASADDAVRQVRRLCTVRVLDRSGQEGLSVWHARDRG
jgi:hypothetical protein